MSDLQVRNGKIVYLDNNGDSVYELPEEGITLDAVITAGDSSGRDITVGSITADDLSCSDISANSIVVTKYRPGQIIEQLEAICDGSDVTVQSGTYTITDVTELQAISTTHETINGSSISYVPPNGTTRVIYEFYVFLRDKDVSVLAHFKGRVDGTDVDVSRHTWRRATGSADHQAWVYNKMILTIGDVESDDIANGKLASYDSPRTLDFTAREYAGGNEFDLHLTNQWDGGGDDILVKPHVKITAIA